MTNIHSCSYFCNKPECIKAQRDELRERLGSMTDRELVQQAFDAMTYGNAAERQTARLDLRDRLAIIKNYPEKDNSDQQKQEPDYWLGYGLQAHTEKPFEGATPLYTSPPQRKPDYKEFMEWASSKGYDTAYAINSDNGKYIPLNPMAADLWKAWQAAHGIKGEA